MGWSNPTSQPSDPFRADSGRDSLSAEQAARVLREHLGLCRELLAIAQRESRALQGLEPFNINEFAAAKKSLLPHLSQAYKGLKEVSSVWQRLDSAERQRHVEVSSLIRQNQDVIMNVVLLDRENERAMLRRGLIPSSQSPSENRQRPHFVADLYRIRGKTI